MRGYEPETGGDLATAFAEAGIDPRSRAEQIEPARIWTLYRALGGR